MQTLPLGWGVAQGVQTGHLQETDHHDPEPRATQQVAL